MTLTWKALAEMSGTFAMIFAGGYSILLAEKYPQFFPSFGIALTWGSVIALLILLLGNLSGAHFNPAVSLAFAVTKRLPLSYLPFYWLGQCAGGVVAAGFLMFLRK